MIRINGPTETRPTAPAKKTGKASSAFRAERAQTASSKASPRVEETAPAAMMSALLELQSEGGGSAKTYAAAQRTLDLLDRLRLRMLEGESLAGDLEALATAASVRAHAGADPKLLAIYDEIALRARVELAKLGR
jgi:hypothetical protein